MTMRQVQAQLHEELDELHPATERRRITAMERGSKRRNALLQLIRKQGRLLVNRRYCMPTSDPDLKRLLKEGKVKQVRRAKEGNCQDTYVVPC